MLVSGRVCDSISEIAFNCHILQLNEVSRLELETEGAVFFRLDCQVIEFFYQKDSTCNLLSLSPAP